MLALLIVTSVSGKGFVGTAIDSSALKRMAQFAHFSDVIRGGEQLLRRFASGEDDLSLLSLIG